MFPVHFPGREGPNAESGGGEGRGGEQDKLRSFVILIGSNALWRAGPYPDSALDGVQAQPVGCMHSVGYRESRTAVPRRGTEEDGVRAGMGGT